MNDLWLTNSLQRRNPVVFYPLFLAVLPILKIWQALPGRYLPEQFVGFAGIAFGAAGLLWVAIQWKMNNWLRSGLLTTILLFIFWGWTPFYTTATIIANGQTLNEMLVLCLYLLLGVNALILAARTLKLVLITRLLNLFCVICLIFELPGLVKNEVALQSRTRAFLEQSSHSVGDVVLSSESKPDVYFILVDAYANPHTLHDFFGYDSPLLQHLSQRGFFICDRSIAPYDRTRLSVPAILNMNYLDDVVSNMTAHDTVALYRLLQLPAVRRLLRADGYRYINVSSGWEPTDTNIFADYNFGTEAGSNIQVGILRLTILGAVEQQTHLLSTLYSGSRLRLLRYIDEIRHLRGPKFVMCHTLICHPPFFMDANGGIARTASILMFDESVFLKSPYLEQLKFADKQLIHLVDRLLCDPSYEPIIVIASDHGSGVLEPALDKGYVNERLRSLTAIYLPANGRKQPPADLSGCNIFRWVFNNYFGTHLPMLPQHSYAAIPFLNPRMTDVTTLIDFNGGSEMFAGKPLQIKSSKAWIGTHADD